MSPIRPLSATPTDVVTSVPESTSAGTIATIIIAATLTELAIAATDKLVGLDINEVDSVPRGRVAEELVEMANAAIRWIVNHRGVTTSPDLPRCSITASVTEGLNMAIANRDSSNQISIAIQALLIVIRHTERRTFFFANKYLSTNVYGDYSLEVITASYLGNYLKEACLNIVTTNGVSVTPTDYAYMSPSYSDNQVHLNIGTIDFASITPAYFANQVHEIDSGCIVRRILAENGDSIWRSQLYVTASDQSNSTVDQSNSTVDQSNAAVDQSNAAVDQSNIDVDQSNATADQTSANINGTISFYDYHAIRALQRGERALMSYDNSISIAAEYANQGNDDMANTERVRASIAAAYSTKCIRDAFTQYRTYTVVSSIASQ